MEEKKLITPSSPGKDQPSSLTPEQVYLEFGPRVYRMARKMVSNESDAEDVTQDVFMQVVRKLPTFRGDSAFPTWLHRVTVNAALAHRRKRSVRDESQVSDPLDDVRDAHRLTRPDDTLLDAEERLLIERAIASLPAMYRDVLVLSDVEGHPNAGIGETLGISVAAVKSRLHRARLLLRDKLAPHFETLA